MKIAQVIEMLKQNNLDDEIAIQYYVKTDMEYEGDEPITKEVWTEAIRLFDKWSSPDFGSLLQDAISQAKENLKEVVK